MNWRRGLLLAGIHLAVAMPLIVMQEMDVEVFLNEHYAPPAQTAGEEIAVGAASLGEEEAVGFNLCEMWGAHYPADVVLVRSADLPAVAFTGWTEDCPSRWTLAGILHAGYPYRGPASIPSNRELCWGFGLLIAAQWLLVGGFPLRQAKRWWAEPGAFITCCAVIGFCFVMIPATREIGRVSAFPARLAWFWWFGLFIWKSIRFAWRRIMATPT